MTLKVLCGDLAPFFRVRASNAPRFSFQSLGGKYVLLTFVADVSAPFERRLLAGLSASSFDDQHSTMFVVVPKALEDDNQKRNAGLRIPGIRAFFDIDHAVANLFGVKYQVGKPISFLCSPRLQVIGIVQSGGPEQQCETIKNALGSCATVDRLAETNGVAPILIVPHVFEAEICKQLIRYYETTGGTPSGFMLEQDGKTVPKHDPKYKVRKDTIVEDENLVGLIDSRFKRRVLPQLERAYQFGGQHMERYIVACYDAKERGHFAAHRDNTTPATAYRQVAATVNLNAEDYEGGELCFPEFGTKRYRAPTGSALIFSCSLLHQANPVTRGRRFAFLPFLYDDASAKMREETSGLLELRTDP